MTVRNRALGQLGERLAEEHRIDVIDQTGRAERADSLEIVPVHV
jgi:hypothetical protein